MEHLSAACNCRTPVALLIESIMPFRVDLDMFRGPLDLLLYLVRKHEVDVLDIPIAPITDQYLSYLTVLEQLDVDAVGDFLEVASHLIEIKSRLVLPRTEEIEEEMEDPRQELVQKLLEYKKYRDAASMLDDQSRAWQQHFPRQANDLPPRERSLADQPIEEVEMWDLVSAFGRILRDHQVTSTSNIRYDDTPIHVYTGRIHKILVADGQVAFSELFEPGMHKSALVGVFLAVLELVRHHKVHAEQDELFGEINVVAGAEMPQSLDADAIDGYEHAKPSEPEST
jgi:segregation and condensation protein A